MSAKKKEKKKAKPSIRVMAVVDRAALKSDDAFLFAIAGLRSISGLWVQLRVKTLKGAARTALLERGAALLGPARKRGLVNGTLAEAKALGLAGAHYPEKMLPARLPPHDGLLAGVSIHSPAAAARAAKAGADYVIAGPVYEPSSKPGDGRGLPWLREIVAAVELPVLAIGGITPARAKACRAAGARGVAVLGGIVLSRAPVTAAKTYLRPAKD